MPPVVLSSGSIVAMVLMDKLGRKVLLEWSFFSMVISSWISIFHGKSFMNE